MISLVEVVRTVIQNSLQDEDGNGFEFLYGSRAYQNLQKHAQFPVAYMLYPVISNGTVNAGNSTTDTYQVIIFFGYKSDFKNWSPEQHDDVCTKARYSARRFMSLLAGYRNADGQKVVSLVGPTYKITDMHNDKDVNMSGATLQVNVQINDTVKTC